MFRCERQKIRFHEMPSINRRANRLREMARKCCAIEITTKNIVNGRLISNREESRAERRDKSASTKARLKREVVGGANTPGGKNCRKIGRRIENAAAFFYPH